MANPQIHTRSISLPTRLNPTNVEAELQKLKSLQILSASSKAAFPVTSEAIQSGLLGLAELYNSLDEQLTQQSINARSVEESLEGSVELLDSCSSIRELFQMIRENVQALQSALRRKGLDSGIQSDVAAYLCFRKKMNKCISKSLKTLKNLDRKNGSVADSNMMSVLREVRGANVAIFNSILVFLSCPTAKAGPWSLVSKLMLTKTSGRDDSTIVVNEVEGVDFAVNLLQGNMRRNCSNVLDLQTAQKRLDYLDACIERFDGELERLYRQLVQSRVRLLNILTDH